MPHTKKKLVHIISSLQRGGAENLLLLLIRHMPDFEHHVFYIHDGPINTDLCALGIATYPIKGLFVPYDPIGLYQLIKQIKPIEPTCIHTSLWAANLLGRLIRFITKIPVINSVHMGCEHEGSLRTFIDGIIHIKPTHTIAVSAHVAESLRRIKGIKTDTITIIQNGIDTELFDQKQSIPTSIIKQPNEFIIGAVGRFVKIKNYHFLLESFSSLALRYPQLRLMLIGSGPEGVSLHTQAKALKIEDRISWIINQSAYPYYKYFDCFAQPSAHEGQSLALMEALYAQLPIIVTSIHDLNGRHDVINNMINGLVIQPNNIDALTHALEQLITNNQLCLQLKENARTTVLEKFTIQQTATEYQKLFNHFGL